MNKRILKTLLSFLVMVATLVGAVSFLTQKVEAATTTLSSYIRPSGIAPTPVGNNGEHTVGSVKCYKFTNTSYSDSIYVKYEGVVVYGDKTYDLYVHPWIAGGSTVSTGKSSSSPMVYNKKNCYGYYKLFVKDSNGNPIDWIGWMGFSDVDISKHDDTGITGYEIVGFEGGMLFTQGRHIGKNIKTNTRSAAAITTAKNNGFELFQSTSNAGQNASIWDTNAIYGTVKIPKSGATIFYGNKDNDGYGSNLSFAGIMDANVTIESPSYTITFNGNGNTGGSVPAKKTLDGDTATGDIGNNVPTKTGHTFRGWSASTSLQSAGKRIAYSASQVGGSGYATTTSSSWTIFNYLEKTSGVLDTNLNLTLYAQWEKNTYAVKYDANGGSGAPGSQTKTYGESLTLSSTEPSRAYYKFSGWNTAKNGSGDNYSKGGSYTANSAATLYAKWTPIPYSITLKTNGGKMKTMPPSTYTVESDDIVIEAPEPRKGRIFTGWKKQ